MRVVGCRKRPPQAPSSRLWEIDDTLSKICQDLSNCRRHTHLHMKQKHVRLSGQLTIRRGHPKTVERKEKSANMVVAPGLHQRILRCGGLWWGYVNLRSWLWLIVDPHLSWIWIKTRMFQTGSVDRARSGGCQSGVKIMFKATIRWWSGRLADHGKILFLPISSLEKFLFDQKYLYSGPSNLLPDHFHLW